MDNNKLTIDQLSKYRWLAWTWGDVELQTEGPYESDKFWDAAERLRKRDDYDGSTIFELSIEPTTGKMFCVGLDFEPEERNTE